MTKALGIIETRGFVGSIEAADVMLKTADVQLVKVEKVSALLVAVVVEGDVSAVRAAVDVGKMAASSVGDFFAAHVIPRPDEGIQGLIQSEVTKIMGGKFTANNERKNDGEPIKNMPKSDIEHTSEKVEEDSPSEQKIE
ncbi:BMC domain-containing protein [Sporosarcina sp. 179-K 3D1 HS]|uniref:BMC domain-containing protein n=1 Tax=Sporosarcina sp. 179-K 3D1 HS TaxID=3232169 RepID=UPI0039A2E84D